MKGGYKETFIRLSPVCTITRSYIIGGHTEIIITLSPVCTLTRRSYIN